ncbi:hypothetical protein ILYODFUR_013974, partial [Ilyodon furcidens]
CRKLYFCLKRASSGTIIIIAPSHYSCPPIGSLRSPAEKGRQPFLWLFRDRQTAVKLSVFSTCGCMINKTSCSGLRALPEVLLSCWTVASPRCL